MGAQSPGGHCREILDILLERHAVCLAIRLVDPPHFDDARAEQQPIWTAGEDIRIKTIGHLPRTVAADSSIVILDSALGSCQTNAICQECCPAAVLVAIHNDGSSDRRQ